MSRRRKLHLAGHSVRLLLFLLAMVAAVRYLVGILEGHTEGPAVVFALLLLTGALALVWRAALDLRREARRN